MSPQYFEISYRPPPSKLLSVSNNFSSHTTLYKLWNWIASRNKSILSLKITVFSDLVPCSLTQDYQCFRGTYCLHFQSRNVLLLHLFFYSVDGSSRFPRNHIASYPRSQYLDIQEPQISQYCSLQLLNILIVCHRTSQYSGSHWEKR
jgi:hypothetical protein